MGIENKNLDICELNVRNLTRKDLQSLAILEQDMRARQESFGEYVRCRECGHIHSKEDMFSQLETHIRSATVFEIEKIIPLKDMSCHLCHSGVEQIFSPEKNIDAICERYFQKQKGFLVAGKDTNGSIRGFFDGFVDSFGGIYDYEFRRYYDNIGMKYIAEKVQKIIDISQPLLTVHASGLEEKYLNMNTLREMQKKFFECVKKDFGGINAVYEVKVGTSVSVINTLFGAIPLCVVEDFGGDQNILTHTNVVRDIYVHPTIAPVSLENFKIPFKKLFRDNIDLFRNAAHAL